MLSTWFHTVRMQSFGIFVVGPNCVWNAIENKLLKRNEMQPERQAGAMDDGKSSQRIENNCNNQNKSTVSMVYRNRMRTTNHYFGNKHTQGLKMAIPI